MGDESPQSRPGLDRFESLLYSLFLGAVQDGNYNTVRGLLRQGVDPRDPFAVCEAASRGHLRILQLLFGAGADLRCHNDMALCLAAGNGHTEIVCELLAAGCDPSVHDHQPLRAAEQNGHHETAHALRAAGSYNPSVRGDSPAMRARAALRQRFDP